MIFKNFTVLLCNTKWKVCKGERKGILVWQNVQTVMCNRYKLLCVIGLSSLLKKNQLDVVYMQQRKSIQTSCHSISLTTEAPWATLVDNLEYKGDMFNEPAPHSLT